MPHDLSLCPQPIIESGHVFPDIDEFRNALYTMSLVDRFQYKFKKNSPKQIYVCCLVDGCPWRIIAHSVGITKILKANIFNNIHNHYVGVECSSQPSMQAMRSIHVIKQIIRATLQYLPYQICKDFKSRYDASLNYKQTWTYKEMTNERIYGLPENSYMLLSWLCKRLVDIDPRRLLNIPNKMSIFGNCSLHIIFQFKGF